MVNDSDKRQLKRFKCSHCGCIFVMMITERMKLLPINVQKNEIVFDDEIFDGTKRRSHLKDCELRAGDWNFVKKKYELNDHLRFI